MSDVFSTNIRCSTIASTTRLPICYLYPGSGWQCCSCSGRRCNEALCSRCRPPDWLERPAGRVFPSLCVSGMQPPCWPQRPPLLLHWTSAGTTQPGPSSGKYMNKNDSWWSMNLINIYYMFRTLCGTHVLFLRTSFACYFLLFKVYLMKTSYPVALMLLCGWVVAFLPTCRI